MGSRVVIGEHLKYFAWLEGRPVALLLWGRASLEQAFGHGLDLLETFVDPDRFGATTYRAANWVPVGLTQRRSHDSSNTIAYEFSRVLDRKELKAHRKERKTKN